MATVSSLLEKPIVAKLVRYSMASVVGVVIGQSLLQLALKVFEWPGLQSNLFAVVVSTGPVYLVNRYWVWKKKDKNSIRKEMVPFWGMALAGLAMSSLFVWIVDDRTDSDLAISAANLAGFGVLWLLKFVILEKFLFAESDTPPPLI